MTENVVSVKKEWNCWRNDFEFEEICVMNIDFLNENMMGPNAWLMAEELTEKLPLKKGMRVLDLG